MNTKETFTQYVARIYPNDTAVVENCDEETLIEFYPDLYEAYTEGFNTVREHLTAHLKTVDDVRDYLETVLQEDEDLSSIIFSLELLLPRLKEIGW